MTALRYTALTCGLAAASLAPVLFLVPLDAPGRRAIALGTGMATLNTIAAHAIAVWSLPRSTQVFLGAILGGMVGRMAVLLVGLVIGVLALDLPKGPLAVSLLGYFFLFLVLELAFIHRAARRRVVQP